MYKKTKLITSLFAGALIWTASLTAQAAETVHSGINCQAANLAQANLMSWNKDGITNNAFLDLYVICPVDVNQNDWDATPALRIEVSIWMPPTYGPAGLIGPQCFGRSGVPNNQTPTNDQNFVTAGFNVGSFDPIGGSGDTDTANVTLNGLNSSSLRSSHILCLLPKNGGTLLSYAGRQQ